MGVKRLVIVVHELTVALVVGLTADGMRRTEEALWAYKFGDIDWGDFGWRDGGGIVAVRQGLAGGRGLTELDDDVGFGA